MVRTFSNSGKCQNAGIALIIAISLFQIANALYNSSDPLIILNATTFHNTILGTDNAWIVEFYASWCGHCIRFAPLWREFSFDVMDWDHTIKVAVLDCADEENTEVCRDYEVTSYPTIRLFGSNTLENDLGRPQTKGSSEELQQDVIIYLSGEEKSNAGSKTWVNLLPYQGAVKDIFDLAPQEAEHAVVIVDDQRTFLPSQCILDLGNYKTVYVRRMDLDSPELDQTDIPTIPAIIVVDRSGKVEFLQGEESTREEITALILHKFQLQRKKFATIPGRNITNGTDDSSISSLPTSNNSDNTDQVYMVDIENALSYALRHEVALMKNISGSSFAALVNFTNTLVKDLPARPQIQMFLQHLQESLKARSSISGEEFERVVDDSQSVDSILPDLQSWKGCLGSTPKYRGYPCGLWTLFHTLTVNAVLRNEDNPSYDPKEVLRAIHGYVKYFFSCEHCSQHFQEMYAEDMENYVQNPDDEILWLWKSHNEVNERLKGDSSEDPQHVKRQFPVNERCPTCRINETTFNEKNVKTYLKKIYGEESISKEGAQDFSATVNPEEQTGKTPNISAKVEHIVTSCALLLIYLGCFSWL